MKQDGKSGWVVGALAVVAVACCAFPVIAAGAFSAAAGVGLGSWLLVALGIALIGVGFWRARRHAACPPADENVPAHTEGR